MHWLYPSQWLEFNELLKYALMQVLLFIQAPVAFRMIFAKQYTTCQCNCDEVKNHIISKVNI